MSITVTKELSPVMPMGNPMVLGLQTDNHYSSAGSKAVLEFAFVGIDTTSGHAFTLFWNNQQVTMTLVTTPDSSGSQITKATGGQAIDDWMAIFAADLMSNYYLARDFDCEVDTGTDKVTLTAKEVGSVYSFTSTSEDLDNVVLTPTAGTDKTGREDYQLLCRTSKVNGSVTFLNEDRLSPAADGSVQFDVHDLFLPELTAEFKWPEESATLNEKRANHIKQYRLDYAELYENGVKKLTQYSSTVYAILGAFDYKMVAGLNDIEYGFLDFITTYKSFLTWQPTTKTINKTQPEKLFFLVFNDISLIDVMIKVYYTDGTNSGDQQLIVNIPVNQYEVWELMVGYSQIDFSKWSAKEVEKYEIWLVDDTSAIQSQTRTYIIDTRTYRHERIFLFRNSFGGFDTFRATGRKTQMNEYERMILEKNDQEFSVKEVYQALESQTFTINSGWISRDVKNWLRELILSQEVYEIIGGYKFPVIITNDKIDLFDDDTYLFDLKLEYKYSFKDPNYSGEYTLQPLLAENLEILLNEEGEPLFA